MYLQNSYKLRENMIRCNVMFRNLGLVRLKRCGLKNELLYPPFLKGNIYMRLKKLVLPLLGLFYTGISYGAESLGTVNEFIVTNSDAVRFSLVYKGGDAEIDCKSGSSWKFEFYNTGGEEYKAQWVSMLIAAKISQHDIRIGYTPNNSGICSVGYIYFPE